MSPGQPPPQEMEERMKKAVKKHTKKVASSAHTTEAAVPLRRRRDESIGSATGTNELSFRFDSVWTLSDDEQDKVLHAIMLAYRDDWAWLASLLAMYADAASSGRPTSIRVHPVMRPVLDRLREACQSAAIFRREGVALASGPKP